MAFTSALGTLRHIPTSFRWSLMVTDWQGQTAQVTDWDWNLSQSKDNPPVCFLFFFSNAQIYCMIPSESDIRRFSWCLWRAPCLRKVIWERAAVPLSWSRLMQRLIAVRNGHSCCCGVTHLLRFWVQELSGWKARSVVQLSSVMVNNYTCGCTVVCVCVGRDSDRISAGWLMDTPVGCHSIDPLVIAAVLRTVPCICSPHCSHQYFLWNLHCTTHILSWSLSCQ